MTSTAHTTGDAEMEQWLAESGRHRLDKEQRAPRTTDLPPPPKTQPFDREAAMTTLDDEPAAAIRDADMEQWLANFGSYLETHKRLSARTCDTYTKYTRIAFRGIRGSRGWRGEITPEQLKNFLEAESKRGLAPGTLRTQMFSLTAYYAFLDHIGVTHHAPLKEVKPPRPFTSEREFYTDAHAEAILAYALSADNLIDRLGGVVLATLNYTGLRLDELVNARLDQLDLDRRRIRVIGKGRKPRTVPIPHSLAPTLDEYLTDMRPTLKASPFVFVNPRSERQGANAGKYGEKTVNRLTKRLGDAAGVPGRHHPHKWRHTYATRLLRNGVDIHKIQRLLGHANINTTVVYLHLVDDDLRDAVDGVF
jgi:integrase/recombinase XerC